MKIIQIAVSDNNPTQIEATVLALTDTGRIFCLTHWDTIDAKWHEVSLPSEIGILGQLPEDKEV